MTRDTRKSVTKEWRRGNDDCLFTYLTVDELFGDEATNDGGGGCDLGSAMRFAGRSSAGGELSPSCCSISEASLRGIARERAFVALVAVIGGTAFVEYFVIFAVTLRDGRKPSVLGDSSRREL